MGGSSGNDKGQLLFRTRGPGKSDQTQLRVKGTGWRGLLSPEPPAQCSVPILSYNLSASDHTASPSSSSKHLLVASEATLLPWVPILTAPLPLPTSGSCPRPTGPAGHQLWARALQGPAGDTLAA